MRRKCMHVENRKAGRSYVNTVKILGFAASAALASSANAQRTFWHGGTSGDNWYNAAAPDWYNGPTIPPNDPTFGVHIGSGNSDSLEEHSTVTFDQTTMVNYG